MTKTALLVLAFAVTACKSDSDTKQATAGSLPELTSLDAVRADFNAHKGEARFITLLSPT